MVRPLSTKSELAPIKASTGGSEAGSENTIATNSQKWNCESGYALGLIRPNETKLTGPPPPAFARKKARTGGSG